MNTEHKIQNQFLQVGIADRLLLQNCLPEQGGRFKMKLIADLYQKLDFTPEEIEFFKLKEIKGGFVWDHLAEQPIQIELTAQQVDILKETISEADRREIINRINLPMIEAVEVLI